MESIPGEDSLPGLQMSVFLLCPLVVGRESELPGVSVKKNTNLIGSRLYPMTSFDLNYFFTPNTATLGVRASTYGF